MLEARVTGIEELDQQLSELPKAVAAGVIRAALKKAGQPVADMAGSGARVGATGQYARSFIVSTSLSKRQRKAKRMRGDAKQQATIFIGSTDRKAHLLEFGTVKMRAFPTLRPAWDALRHQVLASIGEEMWRALSKAKARIAKRALKAGA